jgi:hypothetical protein
MSSSRETGTGGRRAGRRGCYLGASGLLQPMSQDFLYRSPHSRIHETSRRRRETRDEGR